MRSRFRRLVRRGDHHSNNLRQLPSIIPPVVTSVLSQVLGGGNQATTIPPAQTQTSGGAANTPPPGPQTTSPGVGNGGGDVSPGRNPPSSNGDGGSNNPLSPSRTQLGVPVGSGTATDPASIAAQSQVAAAGVGSNALNHPITGGSNSGQSGTPSDRPNSGGPHSPTSSGSAGPTSSSGSAGTHHHLSPGAVFTISCLSLLFIAAVITFVLRYRNSLRRNHRKQRWFGIGGLHALRLSNGSEYATFGSGTESTRSSFATNIDHGLTPLASEGEFHSPTPPPMAEVRQSVIRIEVHTETGSNRTSVASSYSGTQYALVPGESDHNLNHSMPMIVSPFTPTEQFAFPPPPSRPSTAEMERSITEDAKASSLWLNKCPTPPPVVEMPAPALLAGHTRVQPVPPSPTFIPPRSTTANPFTDPCREDNRESKLETVQRIFAPTLGDELGVVPGDQVIIQEVFDDGWAYVEKGDANGLIPIDCLRETGQDLSSFLACRKVNNYSGLAV